MTSARSEDIIHTPEWAGRVGLSFTTQSPPCAPWEALLAVSEGFAVFLKVERLFV